MNENKAKWTPKRIGATVMIVILVALYIVTLVSACLSFPGWQRMFAASLVATIGLPILFWIYIWCYGALKDKHTIASFKVSEDEESMKADSNPDDNKSE